MWSKLAILSGSPITRTFGDECECFVSHFKWQLLSDRNVWVEFGHFQFFSHNLNKKTNYYYHHDDHNQKLLTCVVPVTRPVVITFNLENYFQGISSIKSIAMSKLRFSTSDVQAMVRDIRSSILGQRVSNIYDVNDKTYLFKFAVPGAEAKTILLLESGVRYFLLAQISMEFFGSLVVVNFIFDI